MAGFPAMAAPDDDIIEGRYVRRKCEEIINDILPRRRHVDNAAVHVKISSTTALSHRGIRRPVALEVTGSRPRAFRKLHVESTGATASSARCVCGW